MSSDSNESYGGQSNSGSGGSTNRRECPHCGLWFRLDEARPAGPNEVKCPYCDWRVQKI
jgi:predicted Zn finger-like uncharacterized protein